MAHRMENKPAIVEPKGSEEARSKDRHERNSLGISRFIYALGESAKDGLVLFGVATLAFLAVFVLGKNNKYINQLKKTLYESEHIVKAFVIELWNKVFNQRVQVAPVEDYTKKTPWAVAASFGFLASHLGQLPGLRRGYRKVDSAIRKYDAAMAENAELKKRLSNCGECPVVGAQETAQPEKIEEPERIKNWLKESELSRSLESSSVSEVTR